MKFKIYVFNSNVLVGMSDVFALIF